MSCVVVALHVVAPHVVVVAGATSASVLAVQVEAVVGSTVDCTVLSQPRHELMV